ncbi:hypothetical protein KIW84_044011 [Lathyrus oleraceus]|uniref:Uncharacterized protein n=1 Tax=Pisum sativum TaxID=3888 RepID=A0A9D5ASG6_PEA|nr:hypothetical protein KIW84_044011 [Pisum sativum]
MDNLEGTMEQIRQLVMEQQSRPQVTLEQIQQLIQEQHARNHVRHKRLRGRGYEDDEDGEGSERSTISQESRPRHRRHGGGSGTILFGSRRRLEIPIFKGEDAYGWLVRIERYFHLNGVRVRDKLEAVVLAMEDKALN